MVPLGAVLLAPGHPASSSGCRQPLLRRGRDQPGRRAHHRRRPRRLPRHGPAAVLRRRPGHEARALRAPGHPRVRVVAAGLLLTAFVAARIVGGSFSRSGSTAAPATPTSACLLARRAGPARRDGGRRDPGPQRAVPDPAAQRWFTRLGSASLVVYLFHGFLVKGAEYADIGALTEQDPVTGFLLVSGAAVLVSLLFRHAGRQAPQQARRPDLDALLRARPQRPPGARPPPRHRPAAARDDAPRPPQSALGDPLHRRLAAAADPGSRSAAARCAAPTPASSRAPRRVRALRGGPGATAPAPPAGAGAPAGPAGRPGGPAGCLRGGAWSPPRSASRSRCHGSPTRIDTGRPRRRSTGRPAVRIRCGPQIANGTSGAPVSRASATAPGISARTVYDVLTPASGKRPTASPRRSRDRARR